jgi:hypothetical protein
MEQQAKPDNDKTLEQKRLFAKLLLKRPNDALMIAAEILGRDVTKADPFMVMNMAHEYPNDAQVISFMEEIKNTPLSKVDLQFELQQAMLVMLKNGEYEPYHKTARLYADLSGFITKEEDKGKRGEGKLHELIDAITVPLPSEPSTDAPSSV